MKILAAKKRPAPLVTISLSPFYYQKWHRASLESAKHYRIRGDITEPYFVFNDLICALPQDTKFRVVQTL